MVCGTGVCVTGCKCCTGLAENDDAGGAAVDAQGTACADVVVDGEPFWGSDRLPQIEQWLAKGPW